MKSRWKNVVTGVLLVIIYVETLLIRLPTSQLDAAKCEPGSMGCTCIVDATAPWPA